MKKTGILNAQLMGLITALGHKDEFMIAAAGMPIPKGVEIGDLALVGGVPSFRQVMDAVLAETCVESYTLAEEIDERHESVSEFSAGAVRCLFGLGKKMLLANAVARIADAAFAAVMPSALFAWLGAVAYTFQIYFDFSAYSDMAIGLGRMFGFHFLENFNYPYIARSVTEFWRRWNNSQSTWIRDYVYIPLGGNRC